MRIALEARAMSLAAHNHLQRNHSTVFCNKRRRTILLNKREGDIASESVAFREKAEHITGRLGRECALVGDDIVLLAIACGDVILGNQSYQFWITRD